MITILLGVFVVLTSVSSVSAASTVYINATGSDTNLGTIDSPYQTIGKGISSVDENGTVQIADGNYSGDGNTNLTISRSMTIAGQSQNKTIINGTGTNWIFHINPNINVTIINLTLTNATAAKGGAIYNEGNLTATNCTFTSNKATISYVYGGGAIYNKGTITSLSGCTFTNNKAAKYGGAVYNDGTITSLSGCNFTDNIASNYGGGGAIFNYGTLTATDSVFTGNRAYNGGAINNQGNLIAINCTFTGNSATIGGAIENWGNGAVTSSTFTDNTAYSGGAISNDQGTLIAENCAFIGNTATSEGGAIYNDDSLTAYYNRFYNNTAPNGDAIYCYSGSVDADYNWWSSNLNPKNIDNLIDDPNNLVDATYWVILTVTAAPNSIKNTQTSIITADLNHYTDSSGNIGTLTDHIPDVPVTFAVDANGNLDSLSGIISNGLNAATAFTATRKGLATLNTVVDEFTRSTAITITNNPPTVPNYDVTTQEDTSTGGTVAGNDVDTEDVLSYSVTKNPSHGTLTSFNPNTGAWTYMPSKDYNGDDCFEVTVSDGDGGTAVSKVTIHVTAVNDAPVANDDSQTIDEDTNATGQVTATDVDGDSLTYSKGNDPAHGTVTVNNNGTWTYTPEANYHGNDSFKVLVSDGNGGTAVSTVFITVNSVNDIPVAQNDTATTKEGKPTNINVLGNDSDADGDSLTVDGVTQPSHGSATINADGTLTYTPNSNWYGSDSFTYTIIDGKGGTAAATVTITVNHAVSGLYIKTTTSSQNPTVGETFKITYKLGNNGPDEAKNVTITFQLPESLNFVNIHVDSGKCIYNEITRTVTWTLDSVPVGDPYLYLTVQAAGDGTYNIIPNITSDTYNTNTSDNGTITINVQPNNNNGNSNNENTVKAASKTTIGLQDTGLPLNYLLLAILMVLSGLVPKKK